MSKVKILIGLPMAGKSTYVEKVCKNEEYKILSADSIRIMLTGEENRFKAFKKQNEELVWDIFYESLDVLLRSGKDIIIDNTNCDITYLRPLINTINQYEVDMQFVVIDTDKETCKSRLQQDESHMEKVIDDMEDKRRETLEYLLDKGYCIKIVNTEGVKAVL